MIYYCWNEACRHWKYVLISALQIAIILFLVVVLITTVKVPLQKYLPLREALEGQGTKVFYSEAGLLDEAHLQEVFASIAKGERFIAVQTGFVSVGEKEVKFFAYDEQISKYKPELYQGKWYTDGNAPKGTIPAVVSSNSLGLKVGDTIEVTNAGKTYRVYISGMLYSDSLVYAPERCNIDDSAMDLYSPIEGVALYLSQKDVKEASWEYFYAPMVIFCYEDGISRDERSANVAKLSKEGFEGGRSLPEVSTITKGELWQKMSSTLPLLLAAILLISFSIAGQVTVQTLKNLSSYGIMYTCGMDWNRCMIINVVQAVLSSAFGFFMMLAVQRIISLSEYGSELLFELGVWQEVGCMIVVVYIAVISAVFPYGVLRRNPPSEVLRTARA